MSDIFFFTIAANVRDQWYPDELSCPELYGRPEFFDLYTDALASAESRFSEEDHDVVIVYYGGWDCRATAVSAVSRASGGKASPPTRHNMPILRTERDASFVLFREFALTFYSGV